MTMQGSSNEGSDQEANEFTPQKLPWNYLDQNVNVALTGKAFRHVQERQQ